MITKRQNFEFFDEDDIFDDDDDQYKQFAGSVYNRFKNDCKRTQRKTKNTTPKRGRDEGIMD